MMAGISTYLSILPAGDARAPSRDAPIYSPYMRHCMIDVHRSSFGNVLNAVTKSAPPSSGDPDVGLRIRLAMQDVLLPFVDREKEVYDLFETGSSGRSLRDQLRAVHSKHASSDGTGDEWQRLCDLLFRTPRETLGDRPWLKHLHSIVFARSPRLWCHLLETLGAHEIAIDEEDHEGDNKGHTSQLPPASPLLSFEDQPLLIDTALSPQSPPTSFEVLTTVPASFAKSPRMLSSVSVRDDEDKALPAATRTSSGVDVSSCDEQEAVRVLKGRKNSFAGLRVRMPSLSSATTISSAHSSSASRSGSFSALPDVSFASHRRLSQLFMTPVPDGPPKKDAPATDPSRPHHHIRQRSQPENGSTLQWHHRPAPAPLNGGGGGKRPSFSSTWSEIHSRQRERRLESDPTAGDAHDVTVPKGAARKRSRTLANVNAGSSTWPRNVEMKPLSQSFLEPAIPGLMPDGRTRHPSASSSDPDSKAAISAFRDSMRLSSSAGGENMGSIGSASSSRRSSEAASEGEVREARSVLKGPESNSDAFAASTPVDIVPARSSNGEDSSPHRSPNQPGRDATLAGPSESGTASSIIFPIPPSTRFSRPKELLQSLDEAQTGNRNAWQFLVGAIGPDGVAHTRRTIERCGERAQCSDEKLVTRLAANCFGMVDMNLVTSGYAISQRQSTLDARLRGKPWYTHRQKPSGSRPPKDDTTFKLDEEIREESECKNGRMGDAVYADVDHEARLQAYYDDVEGYEERWTALEMLVRDIWSVDNDVLSVIRQRCGPATRIGV